MLAPVGPDPGDRVVAYEQSPSIASLTGEQSPARSAVSAPCILQGLWMFDGKNARYPRLQVAPR